MPAGVEHALLAGQLRAAVDRKRDGFVGFGVRLDAIAVEHEVRREMDQRRSGAPACDRDVLRPVGVDREGKLTLDFRAVDSVVGRAVEHDVGAARVDQ